MDDSRQFWFTLGMVIALGTAVAFMLGIESSWGYIPLFGILALGGLSFLGLGILQLLERPRRRP